MKLIFTLLFSFMLALSAFGQVQPISVRSTNGIARGASLVGNTRIGTGAIATNVTLLGTSQIGTGAVATNLTISGTLTALGNVNAVGTVTGGTLVSGGDINADGAIAASGDILANAFIGNGSQLTDLPSGAQNIQARNVMLSDGADGGGSVDARAALLAADSAVTSTNGTVYLPSGTYRVASTLVTTNHFWFGQGAKVSVDSGATWYHRGPISAREDQHIFTGAGTVSFQSNYFISTVYVDWFGADSHHGLNGAVAVPSDVFIQRAINAARIKRTELQGAGSGLAVGVTQDMFSHFPAMRRLAFRSSGFYVVTNKVVLQELWHGKVSGQMATIYALIPTNNVPVIECNDVRYLTIEDLIIKTYRQSNILAGIRFNNITAVENQVTPFNNYLNNVKILGHQQGFQYCVMAGMGIDANNERFLFNNCAFFDYERGGVLLAGSQAYDHLFVNCTFSGGNYGWWGVTSFDPQHAPEGVGTFHVYGGGGGANIISDIVLCGNRPTSIIGFDSESSFHSVVDRFFPVPTNSFAFNTNGTVFFGTNNLVAGFTIGNTNWVQTSYTNDYTAFANQDVWEYLVTTGGVHRIAVTANTRVFNPSIPGNGTLFNIVKVGEFGITNFYNTRGAIGPGSDQNAPVSISSANFSSPAISFDGAVVRLSAPRPVTITGSRFYTYQKTARFGIYGGAQSAEAEDGKISIVGTAFRNTGTTEAVPHMRDRVLILRGDGSQETNHVGSVKVSIHTLNNSADWNGNLSNVVEHIDTSADWLLNGGFTLAANGTNALFSVTNDWVITATDTNVLVISGAGTAAANGNYSWTGAAYTKTGVGVFYNGDWNLTNASGTLYIADSFPISWEVDSGSGPAPTGAYGGATNLNPVVSIAGAQFYGRRTSGALYVDYSTGHDLFYERGNPQKPLKTFNMAVNTATNFDTIILSAGQHPVIGGTNLQLKTGTKLSGAGRGITRLTRGGSSEQILYVESDSELNDFSSELMPWVGRTVVVSNITMVNVETTGLIDGIYLAIWQTPLRFINCRFMSHYDGISDWNTDAFNATAIAEFYDCEGVGVDTNAAFSHIIHGLSAGPSRLRFFGGKLEAQNGTLQNSAIYGQNVTTQTNGSVELNGTALWFASTNLTGLAVSNASGMRILGTAVLQGTNFQAFGTTILSGNGSGLTNLNVAGGTATNVINIAAGSLVTVITNSQTLVTISADPQNGPFTNTTIYGSVGATNFTITSPLGWEQTNTGAASQGVYITRGNTTNGGNIQSATLNTTAGITAGSAVDVTVGSVTLRSGLTGAGFVHNGGGGLRWSANGIARLSADTAANSSTLWLGQTATGWPWITGSSNTTPTLTFGAAGVFTNTVTSSNGYSSDNVTFTRPPTNSGSVGQVIEYVANGFTKFATAAGGGTGSNGLSYVNYPAAGTVANHLLELQFTNGVNAVTIINNGVGASKMVLTNYEGDLIMDLDTLGTIQFQALTLQETDGTAVLQFGNNQRALSGGGGTVAFDFNSPQAPVFGDVTFDLDSIASGDFLIRIGNTVYGTNAVNFTTVTAENFYATNIYGNAVNLTNLNGQNSFWKTNAASDVSVVLNNGYSAIGTNNSIAYTSLTGVSPYLTNMQWASVLITNTSGSLKTASFPASWMGDSPLYITNQSVFTVMVYPGMGTNVVGRPLK